MILSHHKQSHGFALIATISVMVLLVMIALAMLSLSTIELRSSQNGRAMAEAQANARMALMIAIGELQKHAGPDTRVTATADIAADDNPPLLGVWKSWEGSDHEQSGHGFRAARPREGRSHRLPGAAPRPDARDVQTAVQHAHGRGRRAG